jgi:hypothetical protein
MERPSDLEQRGGDGHLSKAGIAPQGNSNSRNQDNAQRTAET